MKNAPDDLVVSGLWLGVIFSGCLDLAGDWAEFEGPGWVSPSGKYYQDGALTLPMGECKEYHSEAECQMLSHWGPFGVVNSEFIPLCINNRRFSPGSKFFEGADEACLGLMGVGEHTYDDYVVPGARLVTKVGTRNLDTNETTWCLKCSMDVFRGIIRRIGDYRCIATDSEGFNELIAGRESELWSTVRQMLGVEINELLRDRLRKISRELLFNRDAHNFMGGWAGDHMVLSIEQNPSGDRRKGVVMRRGADPDKDNIWSTLDNCPQDPNRFQQDCDGDGQGDACDPTNCIEYISISPTFHDALADDQGDPQRSMGVWARQSLRTTGGASKNQPLQHMAAMSWCACDDMDDAFCVEQYCKQDELNHRTVDFHGWYPESWFDGEACTRDAEGYCEPLPAVSYMRLDDKSQFEHDYHRTNWDWRYERLPPDGEQQLENGKRYFKFRGFPVDDADLTPAVPEAAYTFTKVTSLEYYVGPLELGNFEQGVFLVPMGQDLAELTASIMGWFKRCASGDDRLPNSLVLTFDDLTGQLDQWLPSTVLDEIQEPMVLADQSRAVLSGERGLDWYSFGGVNPDGTFVDDLWHGVMHSLCAGTRWMRADWRPSFRRLRWVSCRGS